MRGLTAPHLTKGVSMKNKSLIIALIIGLLLFPMAGYCAYNNWGGVDRTKQLSRELPIDLIYKGSKRGGVSTITSTVSKLVTANLAFSILKLSGASKTFSLSDGEVGQEITLVKDEYDARTLSIDLTIDAAGSRTTQTGWRSVTFDNAAGSYVTLAWPSDSLGWIITGSQGVTITY
jgi:hypothetical protein